MTSWGRYLSCDLVNCSRLRVSRSLCRAIRSASLPACAAYISWNATRLATSARHARYTRGIRLAILSSLNFCSCRLPHSLNPACLFRVWWIWDCSALMLCS